MCDKRWFLRFGRKSWRSMGHSRWCDTSQNPHLAHKSVFVVCQKLGNIFISLLGTGDVIVTAWVRV
jgi:hypothetical protein